MSEIWTDQPKAPFGTKLLYTQVNTARRTLRYTYKVQWWWLPTYWLRMVHATWKEGFHIEVVTHANPGGGGQVRAEELH
jgi:hypothetical protein